MQSRMYTAHNKKQVVIAYDKQQCEKSSRKRKTIDLQQLLTRRQARPISVCLGYFNFSMVCF